MPTCELWNVAQELRYAIKRCSAFYSVLSIRYNNKTKGAICRFNKTERVFRYSGGLVLPDPDPPLGIEAVRQVYASSYPEIITAAVNGPALVDGKEIFTFKTAVGTKA